MSDKKDIFDRIMALPGLRVFESFYRKNKSVLLYLFFGGLTTMVNLAVFAGCIYLLHTGEHSANITAWFFAVLFAYVTNRIWVFSSAERGAGVLREMATFFSGRLATLGIEELLLFAFVTCLDFNELWIKVIAQIVVLVSNYVLSKFIVFKK